MQASPEKKPKMSEPQAGAEQKQAAAAPSYEFDFVVLGGGSGGLAAAKEAAKQRPGLKVACLDFVKPSHLGTKWGLGGTCVNVGCIPKKLMHYSGLFKHGFEDALSLGWELPVEEKDGKREVAVKHNWDKMVERVDGYIRNLNLTYRNALRESKVQYLNMYGRFVDAHTMVCTDAKGKERTITFDKCLVAVGGRPRLPTDVPGYELGMTSDDIFWWTRAPIGKVLVNGGGYIALECAGFLHEIGHDVTVIIRSVPLREFDQQVASQICEFMERQGIRFIVGGTIQKMERNADDAPITVTYTEGGQAKQEQFDTVLHAIGRDACVKDIGLEKVGVEVKHGKIVVDELECTSVPNIFAIGDCALKRVELTPVAIKAGELLARRLFGNSTEKLDEHFIPTTVFTPLEYGCVGFSQEQAVAKFGAENVICWATRFGVLESATTEKDVLPTQRSHYFTGGNLWARKYALAHGKEWEDYEDAFMEEERARKYIKQPCLAKLVCLKHHNGKHNVVVGFHYLGPNAGEITQGYSLGIKLGATKADFDALIGIHPTAAEEFTVLNTLLADGIDIMKKGGC